MDLFLRLSDSNKSAKKAFFYGLITAFLIFIPFIIYDRGLFLYYGDFNVQQVPFYQLVHDAIRSGDFFWNWNTDLGVNLIGSYSFYLLTSPFFWLTIPFPSNFVPYFMGPLLVLKIACASLTAYIFMKRYVIDNNLAVLGGLLYAFSGFSIYNIFFNHFHEAIIIFPLLLWSLDCFMYDKKRGLFCIMVFSSCFINYYFFAGQAVFLIIYWIIKMFNGNYNCNLKEFFVLLFEAILGVLLSSFILFPTILCIIQNPRVQNTPQGWSALVYTHVQRYIHILQSLFFPPDIPARPNFTPDSEAKWASVAAWLPVFGMCGVISFIKSKKKNWLKTLIIVLITMAFVPILNSSFQLFNMSYYARWFYMLTLILSLTTIIALNNSKTDWKNGIKYSLIITLCIALPIGLMPKIVVENKEEKIKIGLMNYPIRFWIYVLISLVSICLVVFLIKCLKAERKYLCSIAIVFVMTISIVYSTYIISIGKSQSYNTHQYIIPHCINAKDNIYLEDTINCRVDVYGCMDNQAMFWQFPTIQAFHSIVPGSIMEFYPTIGVTRDVASRPGSEVYALRSFTSCRWLLDFSGDNNKFVDATQKTEMPGWSYYDTQDDFDIWENDCFIPYGFYYNYYITRSQYEGISESNRHLALLKAMVIEDSDAEKYGKYMRPISDMSSLNYSENAYVSDCNSLKQNSCYLFERENAGFTAKINLEGKDSKIVFFSVPYEKGWSATVNGIPSDIIRANVGFMGVLVPAGIDSTIEFSYTTPGFIFGVIVTALSAFIFSTYLYLFKRYIKKSGPLKKKTIYSFSTDRDLNTTMIFKKSLK